MECLEERGLDGSLVMGCVWSLTMLVVICMGRKRMMGKVIEGHVKSDFPGGPVAKIPHSQCREPRFDPWSGN